MFAGTSYGEGSLVSRSGEKISSHRFHKKKIQHSAFVPNSDELFITASNDYTIKLWDVRMINDTKPTSLMTYNTPAASNSAYFDPFYGSLLLVTCQNSSLLVYNVNSSATSTSPVAEFKHFHKFFQHLTPIKATWHPLFPNLAVVGRYGGMDEEGEERFVDIVDWTKGEVVAKYRDMSALGVVSLNEFNLTGDTLVSGMGRTALAWRRRSTMESFQPSSATGRMSTSSRRGTRSRQGQQPRTTQRKSKKEKFLDSHKLTKSQRSALAKKLHLS
jgi:DNA damage-binding protein 2